MREPSLDRDDGSPRHVRRAVAALTNRVHARSRVGPRQAAREETRPSAIVKDDSHDDTTASRQ
jgi:hypothetical protein